MHWLKTIGYAWAEKHGFVRFSELESAEWFLRRWRGFLMVPKCLHNTCTPWLKPNVLEGRKLDRALGVAYSRGR